jgi:hypothetical protein
MTLCRRPKECEPTCYRHGCDPPKTDSNPLRPLGLGVKATTSELRTQSLIRFPVTALPVAFSLSISFKAMKVRKDMPAATLTTTLSELNRLYGLYYEAVDKHKTHHSREAERAWSEYESYARRYKDERGM